MNLLKRIINTPIIKSVINQPIIKSVLKLFIKFIQKIYYNLTDNYERLIGVRDELTPPKSKIFIGGGDFKKLGEEFLEYFIEIGGLKTTDHILDVGCGIGRMAVPLTRYLSKEGSYEGIDIAADGINWCKKKITPKHPNFRFQLANIFNKYYNPKGEFKSSEYKFPYKDKSFDFIFLTSVFTHMLPHEIENYQSEISRVLKKNGKCFITFFLLNQESLNFIERKKSSIDFKYNYEDCLIRDVEIPESAISYNESFVRNLYEKHKLKIIEPIHYGSWCGRESFLSFQDIVIAIKE